MATPLKLNTSTSVVDFLKSQGKPSDFSSRAGTFKELGLGDRLGEFTGAPAQNTALLKTLQSAATRKPEVTVTSKDMAGVERPVGGTVEQVKPEAPTPEKPMTPQDALSALGMKPIPTVDEILKGVAEKPEFKLFQEEQGLKGLTTQAGAEAEKTKLEQQSAADVRTFQESLGKRGLVFSGQFVEGTKSLIENLAASKLGVDRELATKMLQSDIDLRQRIYDDVSKIAEEAQEGRKEAIKQLNEAGYAVVGDELVPTLAAAKAAGVEERAARAAFIAEERLRLSEEASTRAEAYLRLAEAKGAGGGSITSGGLNITKDQVGNAAQKLNTARGADGWTDPNIYQQMFNSWTSQNGLPQDFIRAFPPSAYINPQNKTLPVFLQNKPGSNAIIIGASDIKSILESAD